MKKMTWLILWIVLPWLILGCEKGEETPIHKETMEHESKKTEIMEEMKGLTMESIEKEGKMEEVAPGTVQISSERQQLIGIKIGSVEFRPLDKVIRTVGRVDYDEKRLVTVSPKIGPLC